MLIMCKLLLACFWILISSSLLFGEAKLEKIDSSQRRDYLKQAQVWKQTNIPRMDILAGPKNEIAVPPGKEILCKYVEWPKDSPPSGASPKFLCKLQNGEVVRVKYGKENREVFSEVAASRLLWALGFYADDVYPVRIRCLKCPKNPFEPENEERRAELIFEPALIERNFPGVEIEASEDQGWTWAELDDVDPEEGGAARTHVEALKLLAVLLQHSDNKAKQQRLACYEQDVRDPDGDGLGSCLEPVLMIQDLGATFGSGNQTSSDGAKMNFEGWSKTEIWNEAKENAYMVQNRKKTCFGKMTNSLAAGEEGLNDPEILESGRQFLATLLNQLSPKQIQDLFQVARVDQLDQYIEEGGLRRKVTVNDWTAAFISKRQQILEHECPTIRGGEQLNQ